MAHPIDKRVHTTYTPGKHAGKWRYTMDLVHIARTVKENRQRQQLTIDAVAKKTGVSKGFISRLENFRVTPSLKTLSAIAAALGITMSHFFETDKTAPPYVFSSIADGERIDRDDA